MKGFTRPSDRIKQSNQQIENEKVRLEELQRDRQVDPCNITAKIMINFQTVLVTSTQNLIYVHHEDNFVQPIDVSARCKDTNLTHICVYLLDTIWSYRSYMLSRCITSPAHYSESVSERTLHSALSSRLRRRQATERA